MGIFNSKKSEEPSEKQKLVEIISNQLRIKILKILHEQANFGLEDKGISIIDLTKRINSGLKKVHDPNAISYHLSYLESIGFIKSERMQNIKGRPVIIKLVKKDPLYLVHGKVTHRIL